MMDTIFHYTTATGLLGILQKFTLWASDLRFLNDAQEAVYALPAFASQATCSACGEPTDKTMVTLSRSRGIH
jgi:hypothetical protein